MIYLALLSILFFMQLFAASWYDISIKTTNEKKALTHKMLCSGICLAAVLLCAAINGSFPGTYTTLFICALLIQFVNSIIEEKNAKALTLLSRVLTYLPIVLIATALWLKCNEMFKNHIHSTNVDKIILLCAWFISLVCSFIAKKELAPLLPSTLLLVRAFVFGIPLHLTNNPQLQAASCSIILGALALVISAGIVAFDKANKNSLLRINLYYFGLMFISCSVAVL